MAECDAFRANQVRWPVLEGVRGEGDLLEPRGEVQCHVIALPYADQMPGSPCLHARSPRRITRSIGDEGGDDEPAGPRPGYQQLRFRILCIYALNPAAPAVFVGHKGVRLHERSQEILAKLCKLG